MSRKKFPKGSFFLPSYIHTLGTPNAYCNCSKSLILKGLHLGPGPLRALKCLYSTSYACQAFNSKYFKQKIIILFFKKRLHYPEKLSYYKYER